MDIKLFIPFIKKMLGIVSPSTLLGHGYKYEYDWLKDGKPAWKDYSDFACAMRRLVEGGDYGHSEDL